MDYTKLPKHFIYKDRKDIDDFPVSSKFDYQTLEEVFLEALEERPFIKDSYDAPELILQIFNNARYITTLICLEKHPNHYLRKYLEKAGSEDRNITIANHAMPATMALVTNYLCHYMPNYYNGSKIVDYITQNFNTKAWKELTHGGHDDYDRLVISNSCIHEGWLNDPIFEPRDIRELVEDPILTAREISENIDYILESLQKCVSIFDEEIAPLNAMYKKVEAWFPSGLDDNMYKELALGKIDARLKKLDPNNAYEFFNLMNDMEKSLHEGHAVSPATKENISKYLKKTIGLSLEEIETASQSEQTDDEIEKLNSRIDELEKENVELREQLQEMSDTDEENDDEEGDNELEDDYEEEDDYTDDEEENNEAPRIFKNKIKEDKVIEVLGNLYSDKVIGKRRWYVIYRVLLFIEWLRLKNQIDFINWVKSHFGWNGVREFRGVQSEFTHSDPPKWNYLIVKGKNGKPDNEELGPDYYDFAVAIRDALVDVDLTTGEMQDKDEFRANPHQGVLHNSKWK